MSEYQFIGLIVLLLVYITTAEDDITKAPPVVKPWEATWGWPHSSLTDPTVYKVHHEALLKQTKTYGKSIEIIFLGDSITAGWPGNGKAIWNKYYVPLHSYDYGIGGDKTENINWRLLNGEFDGLSPKLVVLMIGTNNLGVHNDTDEDIAKGIRSNIDNIHKKLPHAKVLLLGILPRKGASASTRIKNINSIIAKYDNNSTVRFLDMHSHFEVSLGNVKAELYVSDGLHLVEAGYKVWHDTMDSLFKTMIM